MSARRRPSPTPRRQSANPPRRPPYKACMIPAMADTAAKVFNIPASAPFLRTLIRALFDGKLISDFNLLADPLALSRLTIYLPTRRACRLAREEFLAFN